MNIVLDSYQQSDFEYDREQGEINSKLEGICKKTGAVLIPLHLAFKQDDDHYIATATRRKEEEPVAVVSKIATIFPWQVPCARQDSSCLMCSRKEPSRINSEPMILSRKPSNTAALSFYRSPVPRQFPRF